MTSLNNQLSMNYEVLQSIIQMQNSRIELQLNHPQIVYSAVALRFSNVQEENVEETLPPHSFIQACIFLTVSFAADLLKKHRNAPSV